MDPFDPRPTDPTKDSGTFVAGKISPEYVIWNTLQEDDGQRSGLTRGEHIGCYALCGVLAVLMIVGIVDATMWVARALLS